MTDLRTQNPVTFGVRFRSAVFFVLYNLMGIGHGLLSVIVAPFLPFEKRYRFINLWTRASMWLLGRLNGVEIEIRGREHLPADGRFVLMANHQSQWETFCLQVLVSPQATILKRELLWVPFFGWALALLKPIRIDRGRASTALKQILRQGKERLDEGVPVVIYPEGTRQPPGTLGSFNIGGAMLACHARVPVVPVAHNSGDCWPARSMLRIPGKIILQVGPSISCEGLKPRDVNNAAHQWIRTELTRIDQELGFTPNT